MLESIKKQYFCFTLVQITAKFQDSLNDYWDTSLFLIWNYWIISFAVFHFHLQEKKKKKKKSYYTSKVKLKLHVACTLLLHGMYIQLLKGVNFVFKLSKELVKLLQTWPFCYRSFGIGTCQLWFWIEEKKCNRESLRLLHDEVVECCWEGRKKNETPEKTVSIAKWIWKWENQIKFFEMKKKESETNSAWLVAVSHFFFY